MQNVNLLICLLISSSMVRSLNKTCEKQTKSNIHHAKLNGSMSQCVGSIDILKKLTAKRNSEVLLHYYENADTVIHLP